MKTLIQLLGTGIISYILMLILVPIFTIVAQKINLTDKPNERKLHLVPIPLIGGISISISVIIITMLNLNSLIIGKEQIAVIVSSLALLIMGVIDDKYDINAKYKLLFQLFCAFVIAASGNRIDSLYGLFGVHELNDFFQYSLTIIVICGTVNAFNLMDGIDGLAGELSIIGFSFSAFCAFLLNDIGLLLLFVSFLGALLGFLKFNFSKKKIFMGDAGSLFMGSMLIGFGIYFLNHNDNRVLSDKLLIEAFIGLFALPVLDSLRVYLGRIKKGNSPFKADKTHLHHLLLISGYSHRKVAMIISFISLFILFFCIFLNEVVSITSVSIGTVVIFSLLGYFLNLNKKVYNWSDQIKALEK